MKKTYWVVLFLLFLLSSTFLNLRAQQKDTSDYFAVGLYGGAFIGQGGHDEFINSASAEIEYFKLDNLSFYLQGLYKFSGSDHGHHPPMPEMGPEDNMHRPPDASMFNLSFGGRYYLRSKSINPFLQLGISHISHFSDGHFDYPEPLDNIDDHNHRMGFSGFNLAIDPGLGLSIKLSKRFNAEVRYDLLIGITNSERGFTGYSILGGLKYKF